MKFQFSSVLVPVAEAPCLSLALSETSKTGFVVLRPLLFSLYQTNRYLIISIKTVNLIAR